MARACSLALVQGVSDLLVLGAEKLRGLEDHLPTFLEFPHAGLALVLKITKSCCGGVLGSGHIGSQWGAAEVLLLESSVVLNRIVQRALSTR